MTRPWGSPYDTNRTTPTRPLPQTVSCTSGDAQASCLGWLGHVDEIPLAEVASEVGQQLQGGVVLYPFGHDAQTKGVAEVDGRANEVQVTFVVLPG